MSVGHGKDQVLAIDFPDGTLTVITDKLTSVELPSMDGGTAEVSTLGDDYKEWIRGQVDPGEIALEGIFDGTIGSALFILGTATGGDFVYHPQGSASGAPEWSGSFLLTSYSAPGGIDDAVTFSATLKVTGAITIGTVA